MKTIKNKKRAVIITLVLLIGSCLFLYYENNSIVISKYSYTNEKIPSSFKNLKILPNFDFYQTEHYENLRFGVFLSF